MVSGDVLAVPGCRNKTGCFGDTVTDMGRNIEVWRQREASAGAYFSAQTTDVNQHRECVREGLSGAKPISGAMCRDAIVNARTIRFL